MWAVHAFKKYNSNKEDYFPNSLFQFKVTWMARAYPSSSGARWQPVLDQTSPPYLQFHTCSLRLEGLRHVGSLTCTCLGLWEELEPPEKTWRYWEKAQTPCRQVHQVGIDFPFHQCYHVTTLKEIKLLRTCCTESGVKFPVCPLTYWIW